MPVSLGYLAHQGPTVRSLLRVVAVSALPRRGRDVALPGRERRTVIDPRPHSLVRAYLSYLGADLGSYDDTLPPHLFPQWTLAEALRTLDGVPYRMRRAVAAGCRLEVNEPLPAGLPLVLSTRLMSIDASDSRVLFEIRATMGPKRAPEALVAFLRLLLPVRKKAKDKPKEPSLVPGAARALEHWDLPTSAGRDYAVLTGDVNPIHWLAPYARLSGYKSVIAHGFSTMARAYEGLRRERSLRTIEVRFGGALVLPARVGLFVDDAGGVFVGDAPGAKAYLTGSYT